MTLEQQQRKNELLAQLQLKIRSNGQGGLTRAQDVRDFEQLIIDELFTDTAVGWAADEIDPAPSAGATGDFHLNIATGGLWRRYPAVNALTGTAWIQIASLRGNKGDKGEKGETGPASTVPGPKGADSTVPGPKGDDGPKGADGSRILLSVGKPAPSTGLPTDLAIDTQNPGDIYYQSAPFTWQLLPSFRGKKGDRGEKGADSTVPGPASTVPGPAGPSAYDVAVANGFTGTAPEWLLSLKGGLEDGNVLNRHLAADIKIGSLTAAANAFPQADRPTLTSVERFLVWLSNAYADLLNRVKALEKGGTGTGTGASVPAGGTTGQVLTKKSNADSDVEWRTPAGTTGVAWDYAVGQTITLPPIDFRLATQITLVGKTIGINSASYSVSGAQPIAFSFNSTGIDTRGISIPAGGSLTLSSIVYAAGYSGGTFFFEGTQS